jgi:hypothetical protein
VAELPNPSAGLKSFFGTRAGKASLSAIAGYFHATVEGGEHIPRSGGVLIVSNHALFALDAAVLGALLIRDFDRHPRFLGDRNLWKIPGLRELITAIGALPGEPHAAEDLLRQGELVIVYPGGVDDSLKLSSQRYQLQWKTRAGFARVAMAAGVPIIPVVGYGIDECLRASRSSDAGSSGVAAMIFRSAGAFSGPSSRAAAFRRMSRSHRSTRTGIQTPRWTSSACARRPTKRSRGASAVRAQRQRTRSRNESRGVGASVQLSLTPRAA